VKDVVLLDVTPPSLGVETQGGATAETAARLRHMLRLRDELEVSLYAAAVIVDLLGRLHHLETEEVGQRRRR
jgi:hypothetical protein